MQIKLVDRNKTLLNNEVKRNILTRLLIKLDARLYFMLWDLSNIHAQTLRVNISVR